MTSYLFNPPAVQSLPIRGKTERFPINRIFCVGRNYHAHAIEMGRPWDTGKDIEEGSVCSEIVPMPGVVIENGAIALEVNGTTKQSSNVGKLIWNIREIIADLSTYYHLQPGDLIYTGTPEGVGAVLPGDQITGRVEGIAELALNIGLAE